MTEGTDTMSHSNCTNTRQIHTYTCFARFAWYFQAKSDGGCGVEMLVFHDRATVMSPFLFGLFEIANWIIRLINQIAL